MEINKLATKFDETDEIWKKQKGESNSRDSFKFCMDDDIFFESMSSELPVRDSLGDVACARSNSAVLGE